MGLQKMNKKLSRGKSKIETKALGTTATSQSILSTILKIKRPGFTFNFLSHRYWRRKRRKRENKELPAMKIANLFLLETPTAI